MSDREVISEDDLKFDRDHLWHPYTSMTAPLPVYPVESARGVRIKLSSGEDLIDGMSSWWAAIHGYNHPRLNAAIADQMKDMSHVMFGGITHKPAIELGRKLVALSPEGLEHVFLCDSGSVSVEVAIKMAAQYWQAKGVTSKTKLLTIRSGYHGDTFQAMSVCDPVTGMHELFRGILPTHFFADMPQVKFHQPWDGSDIASFETLIRENHETIAAVILEPIVQGAGGMRFYHPAYLRGVRKLCDDHDVLLIADEIATGFGRSGTMFACDHASISPDIMCVGKALTGGTMTLAAALASRKVAHGISQGDANGGLFMHGPTFMGNPLACAAANASIDLLTGQDWEERVLDIQHGLAVGLAPCNEIATVDDVRVLGAIGVVEMKDPVNVAALQREFVKRGVWIRPFGKLVYVMPPYIINEDELTVLTRAMVEVLRQV